MDFSLIAKDLGLFCVKKQDKNILSIKKRRITADGIFTSLTLKNLNKEKFEIIEL